MNHTSCPFRDKHTVGGIVFYKHAFLVGIKKKRDCTFRVGKTKALISFVVTVKLICDFVFAYANCWFSHEEAQI